MDDCLEMEGWYQARAWRKSKTPLIQLLCRCYIGVQMFIILSLPLYIHRGYN